MEKTDIRPLLKKHNEGLLLVIKENSSEEMYKLQLKMGDFYLSSCEKIALKMHAFDLLIHLAAKTDTKEQAEEIESVLADNRQTLIENLEAIKDIIEKLYEFYEVNVLEKNREK
jgi:hypothetical protein